MIFFLLTFLAIYSAMHAIVYWGLRPLLTSHAILPPITVFWMLLMVISPLLVRAAEHSGHEVFARGLAWVGYSWMGCILFAFSLFLLLGLWELVVRLSSFAFPAMYRLTLYGTGSSIFVLSISILVSLYGFYEAANLRNETVRIATEKLAPGSQPIRIAQISDLHLGLIHRTETLAPIIGRLRELKPDLIVVTGDMVDAQINHLEGLAELWKQLNPPLGKFGVTGNHEFYAGLDQALDFLDQSGFTLLRNRAVIVGDNLKIVGVDDPAVHHQVDEVQFLGQPSQRFTLLLKHRPDINEASLGRFDLQLSGHTHKGQLFPFTLITRLAYPYQAGLYPLGNQAHIYTSRGTGTWGPPMRIFAPPELTLFEIVPASSGLTVKCL